ncbi:MAG: HAD family hydrolase, partial [Acidimicrobiales bacterium]
GQLTGRPRPDRLVLWDIDGTLIATSGIAQQAFDLAVAHALGRPAGDHAVRMSGKTDTSIAMEILAFAGLDEAGIGDHLPLVLHRLEAELAEAGDLVASQGHTKPGVPALLARLHAEPRVLQSALTGNIAANAVVKLAAFGLDELIDLDVGAYGSDHHDREELVPIALERAARLRGHHFAPDQVWVIGDTPRDLACARAGGARCLLVATGQFTEAELRAAGPDRVVADLGDTDALVHLLLN